MDEDAVVRSETDFFVEFVPVLDFLSSCLCVCMCVSWDWFGELR